MTLFDLPEEGLRRIEVDLIDVQWRYLRLTWDDRASTTMPMPSLVDARPVTPTPAMAAAAGRHALADGGDLYVPPAAVGGRPDAVVVTLHGAGSSPQHSFEPLLPFADEAGLILLAPKSRRATWDIVYGHFGADVATLDELLADLFRGYPVDPGRVFVSGFSDGASYALSLGLTNGDLFSGIVAFSPGFARTVGRTRGKPRVFVSHGTEDTVIRAGGSCRGSARTGTT